MFGFDAAPTATTAGAWAARFGPGGTFWASRPDGALAPGVFEWGNENSYTYPPKPGPAGGADYARSFKMAYNAIKAANPAVGLLCQADDGGTGSRQWLDGMYSAVPKLHLYVAGWVVHLFGPGGLNKVGRTITQTAAKGAPNTVPIAVTEDGIATDDGRKLKDNYGYPTNLTYAKAAEILSSKLRDVQTRYGSRISMYLIYQSHDNRPHGATKNKEDYFGAVRQDLSDKGNWSAVPALALRVVRALDLAHRAGLVRGERQRRGEGKLIGTPAAREAREDRRVLSGALLKAQTERASRRSGAVIFAGAGCGRWPPGSGPANRSRSEWK